MCFSISLSTTYVTASTSDITTLPIIGANIIFQEARLTVQHSPTWATATYQLFITWLPVPSQDCRHSFATWKQIIYDLESSVPLAECKNDLNALSGFETYATFGFMACQVPVFRAHCDLYTDVLWTTCTKPGQGTAKFSHKLQTFLTICANLEL
jgi:hypothetical protein